MERVIEERKRLIDEVRASMTGLVREVRRIWGKCSIFIVGSYARGDFNEWSDVDVLIVVEECDRNPLRRYDKLVDYLKNSSLPIEPIIVSLHEFKRGLEKRNPLIIEAVEAGLIIVDELNLVW